MGMSWKEDWEEAKRNFVRWWNCEGPAISIMAPSDAPKADLPPPSRPLPFCQPNGPKPRVALSTGVDAITVPKDPQQMWLDPEVRFQAAEYQIANTFYGGEAFPCYDPHLGPGNLAALIGSIPAFSETDAWFKPGMEDINNSPPLVFDEGNVWFKKQMAIIEYGVKHAEGRFPVCFPIFSENADVLASLRGTTEVLMDMALYPDAVRRRIGETNEVFFEASRRVFELIRDADGGNCYSTFDIWGPGKTAVIECDLSSMFSAEMFSDMVLLALMEQSEQLDYVMYHLDGSQCLQHLDHILSIQNLRIVQWTPDPGQPGGGHEKWYEMYRKIKAAGKGVQAIWIKPEEIDPLFEAIGPEGVFLQIRVESESEARRIFDRCRKWYR